MWSTAVVFVGGVVAVLTTPAPQELTVRQQGRGPAVPAEPAGSGALGAPGEPGGPVGDAAPAAGPAATASTASTAPATSAAPTTKAKAAAAKPAAAAKAAPTTAAAAAPAAPRLQPTAGSYPLRISGTSTVDGRSSPLPSTGSLVITQQGGDQQHQMVGVPGGLVLVQRANASGVDLVSFNLAAGSKTLTFRPPSPLPYVRTQPGASWSWSVRSTDASVNLSLTANVTAGGSMNVGGTTVPTVTVQRVFAVSGDLSGSVQLTSTLSQVDRLPLVQQQVINVKATVLGLLSKTVVSNATATLTSTTPR